MTQLQISGMTFDSCATHVEQALEKVPGVRSARVSYAAGIAHLTMTGDTPLVALTSAVASLGYRAALADSPPLSTGESPLDKALGFPAAAPRLPARSVHCTSLSSAAVGAQWLPR